MRNIKRAWVNQTGIYVATLSVFSVTFAVICGFLLVFQNTSNLLKGWGSEQQISVYFHPDTKQDVVKKFIQDLNKKEEVRTHKVVSKTEALKIFSRQLEGISSGLLDDDEMSLAVPTTVLVSLEEHYIAGKDLSVFTKLKDSFKKYKGVEEVSFGRQWMENYFSFLKILKTTGWSLILLLIIVGIFIISNSIRVSVNTRRCDIEILELVGSTKSMIRRPFVVEGAFLGFLGGVFGLLLCYLGYCWVLIFMGGAESFSGLVPYMSFLSWPVVVFCILFSVFIGSFSSYICIRQINDGWAARRQRVS